MIPSTQFKHGVLHYIACCHYLALLCSALLCLSSQLSPNGNRIKINLLAKHQNCTI
jgi:hypothetical protein